MFLKSIVSTATTSLLILLSQMSASVAAADVSPEFIKSMCVKMELARTDLNEQLPKECGEIKTNVANCLSRNLDHPNFCDKCTPGRKRMWHDESKSHYCIETEQSGSMLTFPNGADLMCAYLKQHKFSGPLRENILAYKKCVDINKNDNGVIFKVEGGDKISGAAGPLRAWRNDDPNGSASVQSNNKPEGWDKECNWNNGNIRCNFRATYLPLVTKGELLVAFNNQAVKYELSNFQ